MFFDTDILSMLGKIRNTHLVRKLFSKSELLITFEVYNELLRAREVEYDFVDERSYNLCFTYWRKTS